MKCECTSPILWLLGYTRSCSLTNYYIRCIYLLLLLLHVLLHRYLCDHIDSEVHCKRFLFVLFFGLWLWFRFDLLFFTNATKHHRKKRREEINFQQEHSTYKIYCTETTEEIFRCFERNWICFTFSSAALSFIRQCIWRFQFEKNYLFLLTAILVHWRRVCTLGVDKNNIKNSVFCVPKSTIVPIFFFGVCNTTPLSTSTSSLSSPPTSKSFIQIEKRQEIVTKHTNTTRTHTHTRPNSYHSHSDQFA